MSSPARTSRRDFLAATGSTVLAAATSAADPLTTFGPRKPVRVGVISSSILGKPQRTNGHTYHFAHGFHPTVDMKMIEKHLSRGPVDLFKSHFRNPKEDFAKLPFDNTVISAYYDADPASAQMFADCFPGVQVARTLDELVKNSDAIWVGDASGRGEDHFELCAPGLAKGLPTFCDKPIGGTVAETRRILDFAKKHNAPIMSSSLYRHQFGTEEALRMKASGEFGALQYVIASTGGGYSYPSWFIYGQHPVWMCMTLCGPGVKAVNMYAREATCHALLTYEDRMPAEVWYGRPDVAPTYCSGSAHFAKKTYEWTPAVNGNYWFGHHYQIFRMAQVFLKMVETRVEQVPHQEILEVTAI
ncbi:MAG: gfo/Idh/MocA family oxidoreductase, partial [Verrucomicrobia bacterium]|nr:gfo/Idh/MocA family oxidoreductase [Verrucomicrobiota bacterium]